MRLALSTALQEIAKPNATERGRCGNERYEPGIHESENGSTLPPRLQTP